MVHYQLTWLWRVGGGGCVSLFVNRNYIISQPPALFKSSLFKEEQNGSCSHWYVFQIWTMVPVMFLRFWIAIKSMISSLISNFHLRSDERSIVRGGRASSVSGIPDTKQKERPATTPTSVNYHFTRKCNYKCGFCFHTAKTSFVLPLDVAMKGLTLLKEAGTITKWNEIYLYIYIWHSKTLLTGKGEPH